METASKMVEKAAAFASGKSSTEAKEQVESLNKDIEAGQGSSNVNSEEGQGSGIGIQNECRICQEEDYLHKLEAPCHCNGTLKFAHRDCVQKWINERLSMTCEICNQPYEAGYTMVIPPSQPSPQTENVTIPIRQVQFPEGIKLAVGGLQAAQRTAQTEAAAEFLHRQHALQAHGGRAFNASALCRIAAVICLTFLVMKDIYYFYKSGQDSHLLTIFWCCAPNQSEGDLAVVEVTVPEVPVAAAPQYNWTAHRY
ncbi:E3 ubiquitin-protein ligase MARCH11-like [Pyrus ussuriensis x Pyrus communis]|uniref:E3 ubiquitin-protein ligase MARCH11-like n=1 Tax=Pyrus ussuriensis x Pyrus communis TaxID=2448454 RepID=A0A5N5GFK3_9ROSA|nr:E3 ubiquitin-protein ligase MARCH11-like [Pyrus ussuriensis x Pyrus communis]